jgi:hypothetical protein
MEKFISILILMFATIFSGETFKQQNLMHKSEYMEISYINNKGDITIGKLKGMVVKIRALELKQHQEVERLQKKQQEMYRIEMKKQEDELNRRRQSCS